MKVLSRLKTLKNKQVLKPALALMLCLTFVLISMPSFATADATAADDDYVLPYLETGSKSYATQWIDHDFGKNLSDLCVSRMQENGLASAIETHWGTKAKIGKAIACYESHGLTGSSTGSPGTSSGSCAYFFSKFGDYADVAASISVDLEDFFLKIGQKPGVCAFAGAFFYAQNATNGDVGSICNYFGGAQAAQYKATGSCVSAREVLLLSDYIVASEAGTTPTLSRELQDNPDEDCYGCTIISGSTAGTLVLLGCHDPEADLSSLMDKATLAYQDKMMILASQKTMEFMAEQESRDMKGIGGDIKEKYCIEKITDTFDTLQDLLSGFSLTGFIINQILSLIEDIMNWACSYVLQAIDNLLNMVCIPLPTFGLGDFAMPGLDKVYCDGVSAADLVNIERSAPVDLSGLRLENWGRHTKRPKLPFYFYNLMRKSSSGSLFQF